MVWPEESGLEKKVEQEQICHLFPAVSIDILRQHKSMAVFNIWPALPDSRDWEKY